MLETEDEAIAYLEKTALRPEDRPPPQPDLVTRLTPTLADASPFAAAASSDLAKRCEALETAITELSARERAAEEELKRAAARIDRLDEKCLTFQERGGDRLSLYTRSLMAANAGRAR